MKIHCFIVLFFGFFSSTIGSTVKSKAQLKTEETVIYLKRRTTEMEARVSVLENLLTDVLKVNDELRVTVREIETKSQQEKDQLLVKMGEMEMESKNGRNDVSVKLQELMKRVTEVETLCGQSTAGVEKDLRNAENRFKKVDNHLLMEVLQLKPMLKEVVERAHNVEEELTSVLEKERLKTHTLQVQMTELNSEIHTVDLIRKNMSLLTDNLRLQLNESLTFGLENIQTNLTRNMKILENSSLRFEKDCANLSYVSKLDENLKSLEKSAKKELGTLQSEMSARLEKLEVRSAQWDDVPEMKKTLANHSSQLTTLNQLTENFESTCAGEPPSIRNGKPLKCDWKHKSIVQYECDVDFVITGNSTVVCENGKWEGHPPICSFFDTTFTLVGNWRDATEITCYSKRNFQNIEFLRVVDTGSGGGLPAGASIRRQKGAVLDLSGSEYKKITGAYECEFQVKNESVRIVVPFNANGYVKFANRSKVVNIGDNVEFEVSTALPRDQLKLRWRHNGMPLLSWSGQRKVEILGVKQYNEGIYECYVEGRRHERQAVSRLIVRKCGKNRYGEHCDRECPVCYNGGICHDHLGVCICPEEFVGKNCENACSENQVSGDCAQLCHESNCGRKFFCKPDPYGCSCFPGFKGIWCHEPCDPGWYGAECKQPCHCAKGPGSCNITTGACSGVCSPGWTGQSCQIEVVN